MSEPVKAPAKTAVKAPALRRGDAIRILSLSSPVQEERLKRGCDEIARLGYRVELDREAVLGRRGFFAGSASGRAGALRSALAESSTRAVLCTRGGYGSNYLLDGLEIDARGPKLFCAYSDLTSLEIFLWQKHRWTTLYGPMLAAGFDKGEAAPGGYDRKSFLDAASGAEKSWKIALAGEPFTRTSREGVILGGCLTMVETSLGTPWELDTRGAILVLEDRGMKPWQVDRALMHLQQAGKLRDVAGIILGEFPECEAPAGSESVKDVARRILGSRDAPIVWGAPIGHAVRPMLTLPLGVRARLSTEGPGEGGGELEMLEPAVVL